MKGSSPVSYALSRRLFCAGTAWLLVPGHALGQTRKLPAAGSNLTPQDAHAFATAGAVFLVDIRRPEEWAATGSAGGAHRIDMRRKDFVNAVHHLVSGDTSAPIALICARGVRSSRTRQWLRNAGFSNVMDVPEGMLGSRAGPGWIRRKLPVDRTNG